MEEPAIKRTNGGFNEAFPYARGGLNDTVFSQTTRNEVATNKLHYADLSMGNYKEELSSNGGGGTYANTSGL